MTKNGRMLIIFAWAMEIVGVAGGAINSVYTTFGDDLPARLAGYLPAVPMVALAAAELGRVPLASVVYVKHRGIQVIAVFGILALGYVAVENWSFGFERVVDLRLKPVNAANRELQRAEAELTRLKDQRDRTSVGASGKREELRGGMAMRDAGIADLTAQLAKEAEVHQKNLEGIRESCRIIRDRCMVPRSQAEDLRYADLVRHLGADLERQRTERKGLQTQIDGLVSTDAAGTVEIDARIAAAAGVVTEARKTFRAAAEGNQIYRLAANWYGVGTPDVTPEQFAMVRWVFSTFSAVAVALAGSIAALVYYAADRTSGSLSFFGRLVRKLTNARRAYYARRRKPIRVEVPGPERVVYREGKEQVFIEKEQIRLVDQIVLIPRWGVRVPFLVNSLLGRNERASGLAQDDDEFASNVTPLKKAH